MADYPMNNQITILLLLKKTKFETNGNHLETFKNQNLTSVSGRWFKVAIVKFFCNTKNSTPSLCY